MMTPKAVVFDLGKVLLDFDYGIAVARIQTRCKLSLSELQELIDQSPLLLRYEANQLSTAAFFAEVQAASGFRGDLEDFSGLFCDIFTAIEPMTRLHRDLRGRGVKMCLFSNTNDLAIQHIRARFPFFSEFDWHVLSYEHNAMKPDPRLYEVVELTTGKAGPDLLYIDDRPENIVEGRKRGWQTILHQEPETTIAAVRKAGLLPDAVPGGGARTNVMDTGKLDNIV
jgi:FMN phosphatase YigB (HAD superfamily)